MDENHGSFCIHCGAQMPANASFCGRCGKRQEETPAPAPVATAYTPTYAPVYAAPVSQPAKRLEEPSGVPVGAIVMTGLAFMLFFLRHFLINSSPFTLNTFLWLSIYAGTIVSCILHKKNMYFIAGICWSLLTVVSMIGLVEDISRYRSLEQLFDNLDLYWLYRFVMPEAYALIAVGLILGRSKVGSGLRVAGAITALVMEQLYNLALLAEYIDYGRDEWILEIMFLMIPMALFLYLGVLLAKPDVKQDAE